MRGTDAADPRLVLEIALVRLARREAGTPLQALAERIDRLERGASLPARADDAPAPPPASPPASPPPSSAPSSGRTGRSFSKLKGEHEASAPAAPAPPAESFALDPVPDEAAGPVVDIDDVILAWPEVMD